MSKKYKYIKETDSTNVLMKELIWTADIPEGFVVRSDYQTKGKGQGANKWESEKGKNLLFSVLLQPEGIPVENQFLISQFVSLGIIDALRGLSPVAGAGFTVKWPNDIYWHDQKIAGILIENTWQGRKITSSVIGVGINVNQKHFCSDAPNPVSLYQIFRKKFSRKTLLKTILSAIEGYYIHIDAEQIRNKYHHSLYRKEGLHLFRSENHVFDAEIMGVEADGRLMLKEKTGKISGYYFKEVEFVL
jgi:BirA family biotin operon repressor/biotin-[acetyl-CoA-carboxylase] ligase